MFSTFTTSETRNNWYNLQQRRFKLGIRNFPPYLLRITIRWNRLHCNEADVRSSSFADQAMLTPGRDSLTIALPIRLEKDEWADQLKLLPELYVSDSIPFLQVRQWLGSISCMTRSLLPQTAWKHGAFSDNVTKMSSCQLGAWCLPTYGASIYFLFNLCKFLTSANLEDLVTPSTMLTRV